MDATCAKSRVDPNVIWPGLVQNFLANFSRKCDNSSFCFNFRLDKPDLHSHQGIFAIENSRGRVVYLAKDFACFKSHHRRTSNGTCVANCFVAADGLMIIPLPLCGGFCCTLFLEKDARQIYEGSTIVYFMFFLRTYLQHVLNKYK